MDGIAEALPAGEVVRWRGRPDARAIARHVLKERAVMAYLAVIVGLAAWQAFSALPAGSALKVTLAPVLVALVILGGLRLYAYGLARSTEYVVTDRRVVIQTGMALPMAVNLPLALVERAGVQRFGDGTGELAIELTPKERVAFVALWPSAHSGKWKRPVPVLRGLTAVDVPARALQAALLASASGSTAVTPSGATAPREATSLANAPLVAGAR